MSPWLATTTALASAMMGGVFFVFSSFVMPALGRIPPTEGMRAMQRINIDVFHWSFCVAFFGTPALCLGLALQAVWHWGDAGAPYALVGSVIYLVGCLLVTGAGNVPLNTALAKLDADEVDAAREWEGFAGPWVRWNHVRTLACLAAAAILLAGLMA